MARISKRIRESARTGAVDRAARKYKWTTSLGLWKVCGRKAFVSTIQFAAQRILLDTGPVEESGYVGAQQSVVPALG